jgi:hypothetical protein
VIDPALIEAAVVAAVRDATLGSAGVAGDGDDPAAALLRVPVVAYPNRATEYAAEMSSASGAVLVAVTDAEAVAGAEHAREHAYHVDVHVIDADLRNPAGSGVYRAVFGISKLLQDKRFSLSGDILTADVLRWRLVDYRDNLWYYVVQVILTPKLARRSS